MSDSASNISGGARAPRRRPRGALHGILAEPLGVIGAVLVAVVVIAAVFAGVIAGHDPIALSPLERFLPPSLAHPLGTDNLGRDLFARVIYGGRIALGVSLGATLLSLLIGVSAGLAAGYGPRWLDNTMLLVFDALKSFPTVMLALALVTLVGPSLQAVLLVVIISNAPSYGRMVRTQTMSLRNAEFVFAEQSLGAGVGRIIATHLLPNILGPILIVASMDIPVVVAIEAGMSFLGLGVRPPTPSWGTILNDGFAYIRESPWPVVAGSVPLVITTLGFTFLGEALRDAFDPKRASRSQ
ncbi:MAG: peptide/nickel transport system permease protein [Rhodospirillaceae bacterium]|nr:peptide/nickel transport system permease protein [Rhodospirillaceae bacterium]